MNALTDLLNEALRFCFVWRYWILGSVVAGPLAAIVACASLHGRNYIGKPHRARADDLRVDDKTGDSGWSDES